MGASNALAAYATWAGRIPATSMQLLTYMALVSLDSDSAPWFGMGHEALAEHALGRSAPIGRADIKAVERAVSALHAAGAITTDRRASVRSSHPSTVRYRLNLTSHAPRKAGDDIPSEDPHHPPENVHDAPRKTGPRPPENGLTPPENRGTEEPGGTTRSEKTKEEIKDLRTELTVTRARPPSQDPRIGEEEETADHHHAPRKPGDVTRRRPCGNPLCRDGVIRLGLNHIPCRDCATKETP